VRGIPVLAAMLAVGCGRSIEDPLACTDIYLYGLEVSVVDSLTGAVPASATMVVRSGDYVETRFGLRPPPGQSPIALRIGAAGERAGVYDITVRATGYTDWTKNGVVVAHDGCHPIPVELTARMVPQ
jgi:hypothetical protein